MVNEAKEACHDLVEWRKVVAGLKWGNGECNGRCGLPVPVQLILQSHSGVSSVRAVICIQQHANS